MDEFDEWFDKEFLEGCQARDVPFLRAYCCEAWYAALRARQPKRQCEGCGCTNNIVIVHCSECGSALTTKGR
jgi:hypothetical protein